MGRMGLSWSAQEKNMFSKPWWLWRDEQAFKGIECEQLLQTC
jgi:hypothetical protein